jgi:hypothetical protein
MKKFARITIKGEPRIWFDMELLNGLTFNNFVALVRAGGYAMNHNVYIRHDEIAYMVELTMAEGTNTLQPSTSLN